MSGKVKVLANLLIGAIVFVVTLVVFFLSFISHPTGFSDFIALIFVLISEIVLFGSITAILVKKFTNSQMLFAFGIITALSLNWIASIVMSILSKSLFTNNVSGFISTELIILAVAIIISILLYTTALKNKDYDTEFKYSSFMFKDCENLAFSLKSNSNFGSYSTLLNNIYEEIKYSDKTKSDEKDEIIYRKLEDLNSYLAEYPDGKEVDQVKTMTNDILLLIKERNLSILQAHREGI